MTHFYAHAWTNHANGIYMVYLYSSAAIIHYYDCFIIERIISMDTQPRAQ